MYQYEFTICQRIKTLLAEAENCIDLLYSDAYTNSTDVLEKEFNTKMAQINYLTGMLRNQPNAKQMDIKKPSVSDFAGNRDITLQELAQYNGKNGKPAYVAVNGVIYDVTGNAAWAAATHFGLVAGKDLSSEFSGCHKGSEILKKLITVGKLI